MGILYEISPAHSNEYEGDCLLGCCTVMMEAASTSEMSVKFYQAVQHNIPEGSHLERYFVFLLKCLHLREFLRNSCPCKVTATSEAETVFSSHFNSRGGVSSAVSQFSKFLT
jgi:hypothetical protein